MGAQGIETLSSDELVRALRALGEKLAGQHAERLRGKTREQQIAIVTELMRDGVKPRLTSRRWRACSGSSIETIDNASAPPPPPRGRTPCALQNSSG